MGSPFLPDSGAPLNTRDNHLRCYLPSHHTITVVAPCAASLDVSLGAVACQPATPPSQVHRDAQRCGRTPLEL
eukprot:1501630-Prymnesium_polylepis.1